MCADCGSNRLEIRRAIGFEGLMVLITGERKYLCLECKAEFRMPDRRVAPRDELSSLRTSATQHLGRQSLYLKYRFHAADRRAKPPQSLSARRLPPLAVVRRSL